MLSCFRKSILVCVFFLLLLIAACGRSETYYSVLDGQKLGSEQLRGKVIFINYWAEWCKPCRIEIPELNRFASVHADEVIVLSVNFDGEQDEALRSQVKSLGIEFPTLLLDPRVELGVEASGVLPETLVLDRTGEVFKLLIGPQTETSLEAVLAEIERVGLRSGGGLGK